MITFLKIAFALVFMVLLGMAMVQSGIIGVR